MDSGGITKKGLSNSNDQPCEIFGLRVRVECVMISICGLSKGDLVLCAIGS